ncbi:discoidin domain-containing protein [Acinetobacter pseudolwoffii]|uniref:discoidin domain-containing protein n=1 Tax=Acinetobacter pseudolwoffii TaxID=2053287 RepID=UPI003FD7C614
MTDRLVFNWSVDGFVSEQRYYRSTIPIDINNPPSAFAVLGSEARTHIDTSVQPGQTYYTRFSTVKNGVEKFSDQVSIKVPDAVIAFRYVRVWITKVQEGGGVTAIQEIEIAATANAADITTKSMPATASSSFYPASNAFNGVLDSMWQSSNMPTEINPQWIKIDLGTAREFAFLRMRRIGQYGREKDSPRNFKIQGSNNNVDWSDIAIYNNVDPWPSDYKFLIFDLKNNTYQ